MSETIAERWDGITAAELAERCGVAGVHLYETVASTNDVARRLGEAGAPTGTAVLAETQTAGRGRGGKGWASDPGLGIWLSLVVRPAALPSPGLLPVLVGLAVAEALDRWGASVAAQVKWPNDIYLGGRKAGGILCEGSWDGDRPGTVVAGIGLNVLHRADDFPAEVQGIATSIRMATGQQPARVEVLEAVVRSVMRAICAPPERLGGGVLDRLRARDFLLGRPVAVSGAEEVEGIAMGVTPEGGLLIRTGAGVLRTVKAGTVRPTGDRVARD